MSTEKTGTGRWTAGMDEDEKQSIGKSDACGMHPQTTLVNESGLYSLIMKSRKPEAKAFKKWVTSEVLPSIRKTGMYMTKEVAVEAVEDPSTFLARALVVAQGSAAISITKIRGGIQYAPGAAFPPCPPRFPMAGLEALAVARNGHAAQTIERVA